MPQAIDTVMKLGMNHPMGPLTLADLIGLPSDRFRRLARSFRRLCDQRGTFARLSRWGEACRGRRLGV